MKSKSYVTSYRHEAFFFEDDLRANREGHLSGWQRQNLIKRVRHTQFNLSLLVILLVADIAAWLHYGSDGQLIGLLGVLLAFLTIFLFFRELRDESPPVAYTVLVNGCGLMLLLTAIIPAEVMFAWVVGIAGLIGIMFYKTRQLLGDLRRKQVVSVTGLIRRQAFGADTIRVYVRIQKLRFRVTFQQYQQLTSGQLHTLYYLPATKMLLSFEKTVTSELMASGGGVLG